MLSSSGVWRSSVIVWCHSRGHCYRIVTIEFFIFFVSSSTAPREYFQKLCYGQNFVLALVCAYSSVGEVGLLSLVCQFALFLLWFLQVWYHCSALIIQVSQLTKPNSFMS